MRVCVRMCVRVCVRMAEHCVADEYLEIATYPALCTQCTPSWTTISAAIWALSPRSVLMVSADALFCCRSFPKSSSFCAKICRKCSTWAEVPPVAWDRASSLA